MIVSLLGLALAGAAPLPAPGTQDFDVQCMVALQMISDAATTKDRESLAAATMFYFGRVDSVLPGNLLKTRLKALEETFKTADIVPLAKTCGEFMEQRGKAMMDLGAALEAEEKAKRP